MYIEKKKKESTQTSHLPPIRLQIIQKRPPQPLRPLAPLPPIQRLRKMRHRVAHLRIVRNNHQHLIQGIHLLQLVARLHRQRDVVPKGSVEQRLVGFTAATRLEGFPCVAGTDGVCWAVAGGGGEGRNGDSLGDGPLRGRAEDGGVVADVAAEEDEGGVGAGGGAGQAAEVADGVAGGVEEVERAVAEVVVGAEGADLEGVGAGECYFTEVAVSILLVLCLV